MNPKYSLNLRAMEACVLADVPVFLWGSPGSGKSSAVRNFAAERGYRLTEMTPSILDPTDLLGLPIARNGSTVFAPPDWLTAILDEPESPHLVFLDELNLASMAVMNSCLRLVLERAVHTVSLPDTVRFAAAGNDPSQVPTAQLLTSPMSNRFAHFEWEGLSGGDWATALTLGWPFPAPPSPTDEDWTSLVGAFTESRPALADDHAHGGGSAASAGRGYPSARSWDALRRALPYASGDPDLERTVAAAVVGKGAAHEFISFARSSDLPKPEDWLRDPTLAAPLERDDRTSAALLGVSLAVVNGPRRGPRYAAAIEVFCEILEKTQRPSLCQPAVRLFLEGAFIHYRGSSSARGGERLAAALDRLNLLLGDTSDAIERWRNESRRGALR